MSSGTGEFRKTPAEVRRLAARMRDLDLTVASVRETEKLLGLRASARPGMP